MDTVLFNCTVQYRILVPGMYYYVLRSNISTNYYSTVLVQSAYLQILYAGVLLREPISSFALGVVDKNENQKTAVS